MDKTILALIFSGDLLIVVCGTCYLAAKGIPVYAKTTIGGNSFEVALNHFDS